jgi:hypothetical protein
MDDHNENINLDDISIEDIMKNNYSEQDRQEEDFGSDDFNETHFTSDEEEITIDDSDQRRVKERYESDMRIIENLRIEYTNLHRICQQKKQEIQSIKNIIFSDDCRNDKEAIYNSIETETCKSIRDNASHISQNIRTNPRMAKMSLDNLKRDADLLTLQFDYTSNIEQLFVIHADHNKLKNKCDQAKPIISGFDSMREERIKLARREKEMRNIVKEAEKIMNQQ